MNWNASLCNIKVTVTISGLDIVTVTFLFFQNKVVFDSQQSYNSNIFQYRLHTCEKFYVKRILTKHQILQNLEVFALHNSVLDAGM